MAQQRYRELERDPEVREGHPDWTEGKEAAAQIIQEKMEQGEWPIPLNELADETEWSRSHYRNTIRDLFQEVDDNTTVAPTRDEKEIVVEIPEDVTNEQTYLRGYVAGYLQGKE